ncbi:MAG TPA: DNA repair protein RecO [Gemmatimonadaceae bacterium]|nr:DNA repair protein RecO [Gemmatimonadaceae bacterium]
MSEVVTEAIVLHAFDYLETSRILRLLTREAGVQSVLARGARRSRKRFGSAMDLFAQGIAEIHIRPNRELQTLGALDITRARAELGQDVGRFTGASMISEIVLRFPYEEAAAGIFDTVEECLDRIAAAPPESTLEAALGGAWRIIAELGFTPALDVCANCHAPLDSTVSVTFSHSLGGALCKLCATSATGTRTLPPAARNALRTWVVGERVENLAATDARAHQRLLREFFQHHLGTDRELRAFRVWEQGAWSAA